MKEKMYVRCPYDYESPKYPRVFMCGQVKKIDPSSNICRVEFYDPFDQIKYFEDLRSGVVEFPLNSVQRCSLFVNSRVIVDADEYTVVSVITKKDDYYEYYLQNVKTREIIKVDEQKIIASFNNGYINPVIQLKKYEFQNPVWYFGRRIVSKNTDLLNNSVFGFKELAGAKIYLLPHQINAIMRCLQSTPCRFMLADEVGMGKTIEASSVLKINMLNKSKQRILIVVPDSLKEQWKTELFFKFNISTGTDSHDNFLGISSLSEIDEKIIDFDWDFIVVDEVHKIIESNYYPLIHKLCKQTENVLLLSATPVQERQEEYLKLLRLLQPNKYDEFSNESFSELLSKQSSIVQKTSLILSDLEELEDTYDLCIENDENPHDSDECQELYEEIEADLLDVCNKIDDPKLQELLNNVNFEQDDLSIYNIKVLISSICSNYQIENNIIRNRRKMLQSDDPDENLLPTRELCELSYDSSLGLNNLEYATYNLLIDCIDKEIERNDDNINSIIKPLLSSFFSSAKAFYNIAKNNLSNFELGQEIIDNAKKMSAYEEYIVDHINEILDDNEKYSDYYATRIISIFNYIFDNCTSTKSVLFTEYNETFDLYKKALSNIYDEDEYAFFSYGMSSEEAELNAYKFQEEPDCILMLCDSSGGEGRNFQCADYVIHIDLPVDANAIEQRIGRLDRLERDKNRPIVYSVVVYSKGTFDEALFQFWNNGLDIFNHSLSGMEIIMQDINEEINNAIKNDIKYGLFEKVAVIVDKTEKMRKQIIREQNFDTASYIFKPLYQELSRLVNYYSRNENALFTTTMQTWANLAGFHGQTNKKGITTYSAGGFSTKSAINSMLVPPNWKEYLNEKQNVFVGEIQRKHDEKKEKETIERSIRGTFTRKVAIENDYLHFFAPGDAVYDCIIDNAINNCKGQCAAFEVRSPYNWDGFVFTYSLEPDAAYLLENGESILSLGNYKTFASAEQVIEIVSANNPDDLSEDQIKRLINGIMAGGLNDAKKYAKHLGKRSGNVIDLFIEKYPYQIWNNMISEAVKIAQEKALIDFRKHINLRGALDEMQRNLSAMEANSSYYDLDSKDVDSIKAKQKILFGALKQSKVVIDSVAYVRLVNNND